MRRRGNYQNFDTWSKAFDQEQDRQKEERERICKEQKAARTKRKQDYRDKHGDYWYCKVVDAWVSIDILDIPALDKINTCGVMYGRLNLDSSTQPLWATLMGSLEEIVPYTIDEYHDKFCTKDTETGRWVFNQKP